MEKVHATLRVHLAKYTGRTGHFSVSIRLYFQMSFDVGPIEMNRDANPPTTEELRQDYLSIQSIN